MCTVTYLPIDAKQFILTSSRDEGAGRKETVFPGFKKVGEKNIIFPQDADSGGTWVGVTDTGATICLLNGAFERHERKPPYRISRGLMMLEALECIRPDEFIKNYDFAGIEPFTLVMAYYDDGLVLVEFRWDGEEKFIRIKDPGKPQIWSSSTLYNADIREVRRIWFEDWLGKNQSYTVEGIRHFHHHAGEDDKENAIKMKREDVATLSITTVWSAENLVNLHYEDLTTGLAKVMSMSQ